MSTMKRFDAVSAIADRMTPVQELRVPASFDDYAEDVFDKSKMLNRLSKATARKLLATIDGRQPLDPSIADEIAKAMKEWAISRGATHYTHWFQPLTGGTAEKHDSFLALDGEQAIFSFSGKNLIEGEPDASSFPSGGLRSTFEARGYTAWDPTSPAFIKHHSNGATLCIPTVFCSYHGEVLDRKTPLLRSLQALKNATIRLMKCFGLPEEHVKVTLGAEQEYFLIDRKFYLLRPDLVQSGRTVFGAPPPKHQQLEDHYFGAIKPRVLAFMTEVEHELWKLGIPAKTRHNEVAPAQFELAPIFEELNLAVDHNMLVMEVLRMVAARNGFICLLHEKPFAGVNGSGKHNNWSICYGRRNLLDPGSNPHENAIFLTVLSAIIRAVDLHADLLRVPTAGVGQDHRLGANEAPPAIISIYLGDQLADVIDQIMKGTATSSKHPDTMRIGVDSLPVLARDATDRNRTSPFAFTGNKFEFRSMGASQSCSGCNTILNTIVADSMDYISDRLEKLPRERFNSGLQATIKKIVTEHKRIIFNGDGYSREWLAEAKRRGLPNLSGTLEAIEPLRKADNQAIFGKYNVFSVSELNSRYEVFRDEYLRRLAIEGGIALEIARSMILPVVASEYGKAVAARQAIGSVGKGQPGAKGLMAYANRLGQGLDALVEKSDALAKAMPGSPQDILSAMRELRAVVDGLEGVVSDSVWPLPKYREMLFVY